MRCSACHVEVCEALDCPGHCEPICDAPATHRITEHADDPNTWTALQYACPDHLGGIIAQVSRLGGSWSVERLTATASC